MNKRPTVSRLKDQMSPQAYKASRRSLQSSAKELYTDPASSKSRPKVSYIPGTIPREEPAKIPRLFIRGKKGGSIKIDLRGLGVDISEDAFAHWVSDESLKKLGIHRGDIAVIDHTRPILRDETLVLLEQRGCEVIRCLRQRNRIWYLETVDGKDQNPVPLVDQPLQGAVIGIFRLFTKIKPVCYRGTSANFDLPKENLRTPEIHRGRTAKPSGIKKRYPLPPKRKTFLLAAEEIGHSRPHRRDKKSR